MIRRVALGPLIFPLRVAFGVGGQSMPVVNSLSEDAGTVGWLVDREFLKAQHRACVALLAHLGEAGVVPHEHGLFVYLDALVNAFDEREAELSVPRIHKGRSDLIDLAAARAAREVYQVEASSKYLRDVALK